MLKERLTGVAELIGLSREKMPNVKESVAIALGLDGGFDPAGMGSYC
ncbi:hypothetical protein [Falsiroseomonas sp. E2-1-a4]